MRESASARAAKYVETCTASFKQLNQRKLPVAISETLVQHLLELARGYVGDAKHYAKKKMPVTSLACVAYAEGLLDAMKFLELVEF